MPYLFLFLTGAAGGSLGRTKGAGSSSSVAGSRFFLNRFLPWCWLHKWFVILIFIFVHVWCMSWVCGLSLWHGKCYSLFGWPGCSRDLVVGWYARFVKSNTTGPICGVLRRGTLLSPFRSSSLVVPKFFIWERDNKMGTSPVSCTSTLAEHGGVVGKWIMQLSMQVSRSGRTRKTYYNGRIPS